MTCHQIGLQSRLTLCCALLEETLRELCVEMFLLDEKRENQFLRERLGHNL